MSLRSRHIFLCAALMFVPLSVAQSAKPGVDPRVDTLLRQMAEYLKGASEFSFHTEVNYDRVLESGQKILYGRRAEISMRRPNRLHVVVNGDLINERLWYDGKTVVLLDLFDLGYAKIDVPPRLDDALDVLAREYGVSSPIADVLYSNPYTILTENIQTGTYIGRPVVRGVPTHHLAFTQSNIDWQLWIEDGGQPVPRKAVITYKNVASSPQFTVWLSDWNFEPRLADSLFEFLPPDGAHQIEITPIEQ